MAVITAAVGIGPVCQLVAESINQRQFGRRRIVFFVVVVLLAFESARAGTILDFLREYDLNDYSLGVAVATSQNPFAGAPNSVIAYPYLTSFTHSAFTDNWLLIQGENVGFRYISENDWIAGVIGRVQTLGLGGAENDELRGLDKRRWAIEAGPLVGWRRWPVHVQFRSYWEVVDRHDGNTSEIELSLPRQFSRGFFVPAVKLSYLSDDYSQYYFGVADHEATASRPAYRPGSVINSWVGFSMGYQLAPKWLLSTTIGVEFLDSAVSASPIVDRDKRWSARLGLAYNADIFNPTGASQDNEPAFEIRLGALNSSINTRIVRDAADGEPGDEIDLEKVLGVSDRETVFQLDSILRVAYFHRFELGYFELQRESQAVLERELEVGDQVFLAGTSVDTNLDTTVARLAYSFSLMRDQQKELGVSGGLSYTRFEAAISSTTDPQQVEKVRTNALVPTIGVFGSAAVGDAWRVRADINAFALDFDGFEGYSAYASLGFDRKFGDNFGAGVGYSFYGFRLKAKDNDLRGTFKLRHHGPSLYLSASF